MKYFKWLLLTLLVLLGGEYFLFKITFASTGEDAIQQVMSDIMESNPGVTCADVELFGSSLPIQHFYATEFEFVIFMKTAPNADVSLKTFTVPMKIIMPQIPILRIFSDYVWSINRNTVAGLLVDGGICKAP